MVSVKLAEKSNQASYEAAPGRWRGGPTHTRRRLLAAGAVVGGPALAACTGGGRTGQAPPTDLLKQPVTIHWSTWGNSTHPMVQAVEQALPIFKQHFPAITVMPEPQDGGWQEKNVAQWVAGTGPDVSGAANQIFSEWLRKGLMQVLDPLVKRDSTAKTIQDFYEHQWNFFHVPQKGQVAIPMYLGTICLGYNKDLFRRVGGPVPDDTWDWNKEADAMRKLTVRDQEQFGADFSTAIPRLQEWIIQNNGWVVDPKDDLKCLMDQPEALGAMQWLHDRIWRDNSALQPSQRAGKDGVALGKIGLFIASSFGIPALVKRINRQFEWDVVPYAKGKQRDTVATTDGWGIWSGTQATEACWALLKFLESDEWNDVFMRITGNQSARKSLGDRWLKVTKEALPEMADKNLSAFTEPITKGYARPNAVFRFDDDVRPLLTDAVKKTMDTDGAPLADTMRSAVAAVNAKLKELAASSR